MKTLIVSGIVAAGLLSGAALAQAPMPGDEFGAPATTTTTTTYDADYAATGWNPALLLAVSGGLGAGSLALKGILRSRAR